MALDPQNITYRKEFDRAQSLSGGEIAAYKATRAGERVLMSSSLPLWPGARLPYMSN